MVADAFSDLSIFTQKATLVQRLKIKDIKKFVSCNEIVKMEPFGDVLNGCFAMSRS